MACVTVQALRMRASSSPRLAVLQGRVGLIVGRNGRGAGEGQREPSRGRRRRSETARMVKGMKDPRRHVDLEQKDGLATLQGWLTRRAASAAPASASCRLQALRAAPRRPARRPVRPSPGRHGCRGRPRRRRARPGSPPVRVLMPRPKGWAAFGQIAFGDQDAAPHTLEEAGAQEDLAALVLELDPVAVGDALPLRIERDGSSPRAGAPWRARSASR